MSEYKTYQMELAGKTLKVTPFEFAQQASGSATVSIGDTVIMAAATMSDSGREGIDFFPLVVDFRENHYAAGKIKGSRFVKRGGRPSEKATLTSRLIDRPVRPLFPKGITNEVQVICHTLSVEKGGDAPIAAMNAASVALCLSGMPFQGPLGAVRVGLIGEELIINPNKEQLEEGRLDLVVAGTEDAIMMVESDAKEVSEEKMLEALDKAHGAIKEICRFQKEIMAECRKPDMEYTMREKNEAAAEAVKGFVSDEMLDSVKGVSKQEVKKAQKAVTNQMLEHFAAQIEDETYSEKELKGALGDLIDKRMRQNILAKEIRVDGRSLDQVRPISVRNGFVPAAHGSGMFQRGETQVVSVCTLGGPGDAQVIETMDEDYEKRYFHHYNFPPYSVGEVRPLRSPGRREIGHGFLAERALMHMIPSKEEFPYTIWVSSEVFACNGSSSMASVCGSTLSLMDAGVPIKAPVSGVAMGLVTDGNGGYKILTDIQGLEDFAGDMDFKVSGTANGVTSLQMDIKVKGLSVEIMREALQKATTARMHILEEMLKVLPTNNDLAANAPLITSINIDPDMIKVVIGKGGETIQKITKECEVQIDISDEGLVMITAPDGEKGQRAIKWIKDLTYVPAVGDVFDGKVVKIMEFGAFVQIAPGKDGLVHISELAHERVNKVEDVVKEGETVKVKLIEIDRQGRMKLSMKVLIPKDNA